MEFLIIDICFGFGLEPMLTATDERVHLWHYDRQGGIQSYALDIRPPACDSTIQPEGMRLHTGSGFR